MLTEYQALFAAKNHVEEALNDLESFSGGSYYADEAHDYLGRALGVLLDGLRYFETEDGDPAHLGALGGPGDILRDPEGEGEGLPKTHPNARPFWWPD